MKRIIIIFFIFPLWTFGAKIAIVTHSNDSIVQYSISELKSFLNEKNGFSYTDRQEDADWVVSLQEDPSIQEGGFRVNSVFKEKQWIKLSGATPNEILHAVYTFLEKLGFVFEISGFYEPEKLNTDSIVNYTQTIVPIVKYRGIRQHINFPMDISSYPLEDAKKYIRDLARMRFNHITFQCYTGLWYETKKKDHTEYAGCFFYNDTHYIPDNSFIKKYVHQNKKIFCIPEIEPFYNNEEIRSKLAVWWLGEVMKEAKRVGMRIQVSFESTNEVKSNDVEEMISKIQGIVKQYPLVDVLEMITAESGGWGDSCTAEGTKATLVRYFGNGVLKDPRITAPIRDKQTDLEFLYAQVGYYIKTINTMKDRNISVPPLQIGIYCVDKLCPPVYYLARKYAPSTEVCILPGHGSTPVAKNTRAVISGKEDWA